MRVHPPSSHAGFRIRVSPLDIFVAVFAPILSLHLGNWSTIGDEVPAGAYVYCFLSLLFSLIAFAGFKIHGAIPRYLSLTDLLTIGQAVVAAELMTCTVLFTLVRLDGIPRSVPAIHALILGAGLAGVRTVVRLADDMRSRGRRQPAAEHLIVVGVTDLSVMFMKYLEATGRGRIVALLDDNPRRFGRSVNGVRVYGPPTHVGSLISEFATHGVEIHWVLIGVDEAALSSEASREVRRACSEHNLRLVFVPRVVGLDPVLLAPAAPPVSDPAAYAVSRYFAWKRPIDIGAAGALLLVLMPVFLLAAVVAFFDVGPPALFWQRRIGRWGRPFHLFKVRTLRPAFARDGKRIPEDRRVSALGMLLRQTRLDEWPQLISVLVGDMSLIGPRPLLPQDQPENPAVRLSVRPGITGWAQVNGGALLSAAEKHELDSWYIANASPRLDLHIIGLTARTLFKGDRRVAADNALARARSHGAFAGKRRSADRRIRASFRFVSPGRARTNIEGERRPAARSL